MQGADATAGATADADLAMEWNLGRLLPPNPQGQGRLKLYDTKGQVQFIFELKMYERAVEADDLLKLCIFGNWRKGVLAMGAHASVAL